MSDEDVARLGPKGEDKKCRETKCTSTQTDTSLPEHIRVEKWVPMVEGLESTGQCSQQGSANAAQQDDDDEDASEEKEGFMSMSETETGMLGLDTLWIDEQEDEGSPPGLVDSSSSSSSDREREVK